MKKLFLIFLSIIFSVTGIVTPSDDLAPIPGRQGTPTDETSNCLKKYSNQKQYGSHPCSLKTVHIQ